MIHKILADHATDWNCDAVSTLLVIAPHQDDETLACGGLIRQARDAGTPVIVIFVSDGCLGGKAFAEINGDNVPLRRQDEASRALEILHVDPTDVYWLRYADGELAALDGERKKELVATLTGIINTHRPSYVLAPSRRDRHADHEAVHRLTVSALLRSRSAAVLLEYLVWAPWLAPLGTLFHAWRARKIYRIDVRKSMVCKQEALAEYRSQVACFPTGFVDRFLTRYELLQEAATPRKS